MRMTPGWINHAQRQPGDVVGSVSLGAVCSRRNCRCRQEIENEEHDDAVPGLKRAKNRGIVCSISRQSVSKWQRSSSRSIRRKYLPGPARGSDDTQGFSRVNIRPDGRSCQMLGGRVGPGGCQDLAGRVWSRKEAFEISLGVESDRVSGLSNLTGRVRVTVKRHDSIRKT